MKQFNRQKGNEGESLAVGYLQKKGYKIIVRNFRTRFGELDIICRKNDTLIFVEVKTKTSGDFGTPEEMFTKSKLAKVKKMADVYLVTNNLNNYLCRIDLIAVNLDENSQKPQINHYENLY